MKLSIIATFAVALYISSFSFADAKFNYLSAPTLTSSNGTLIFSGRLRDVGHIQAMVELKSGPMLSANTLTNYIYDQDFDVDASGEINLPIRLSLGEGDYDISFFFYKAALPGEYKPLVGISDTYHVRNLKPVDLFLSPSPMVQSDDPEIIELSRKLTKNLTTDESKIFAIHDWVVENMSYKSSRPVSSVEALHHRYGVCREFSALFAALARAAKIKTRVIVGLLGTHSSYKPGEQTNHVWNEVLLNGSWRSVDTTVDNGDEETLKTNDTEYLTEMRKESPAEYGALTRKNPKAVVRIFSLGDRSLFLSTHARAGIDDQ